MAMANQNPFLNALLEKSIVSTIADSLAPLNLSVTTGSKLIEGRQNSFSFESASSAEEDGGNSAETQTKSYSDNDEGRKSSLSSMDPGTSSDFQAAVAAALVLQQNLLSQQQQQQQEQSTSTSPYSIPLSPDPTQNLLLAKALASATSRKPRSQKKPIPDEMKDNKYFERRRRNNLAAKRSRDARKSREDQVAMRANILERENAVLRAQVLTLREEALALHQIFLQKQAVAKSQSSSANTISE